MVQPIQRKMASVKTVVSFGWCVLFICLTFLLPAINYPVTNYTIRDGLPDMAIQSIFKDSRGLMWIGTKAGLCSFDGQEFRTWLPSDGMTASQVWSIAEDGEGNLWFGSFGEGLFRFDGKKFQQFTKNDGLLDNRIRVLRYSKKHNCLVAGSYNGINIIKPSQPIKIEKKTFDEYNGTITGLADAGNFIFITTYGPSETFKYDYLHDKFTSVEIGKPAIPHDSFSCFISSRGDTLFSCSWGTGYFRDKSKGIIISSGEKFSLADSIGQVFGIDEDKRGDVWLASWSYYDRFTEGGIFRYDGKEFRNYKQAFGIEDREIWTVYCDKEQDILWIGTLNQGLFRIPLPFVTHLSPAKFNLKEQKINDLFVDSRNRLWISGKRELIRMDPDGSYTKIDKLPMISAFRQFWEENEEKSKHPLSPLATMMLKIPPAGYAAFAQTADFDFGRIIEDSNGGLWICSDPGMYYLDELRNITYLSQDGSRRNVVLLGDTLIMAGTEDTSYNTLVRNLPEGEIHLPQLSKFSFLKFNPAGHPRDVSRMAVQGNRVWFASWTSGLWMREGGKLVNFNNLDPTLPINLTDICVDARGNLIFGSATGELFIAQYHANRLTVSHRVSQANGLQGNNIRWIAAGANGKLWVGTNEGLNKITPGELNPNGMGGIRFFDEEEGYTGQFSERGVLDQQGNLWIDGTDQLIKIETAGFSDPIENPGNIRLQGIEINNVQADSVLGLSLTNRLPILSGELKLKHTENDLVFHFGILNYRNPAKELFRYRLEGYDGLWNSWSNQKRAVYTNLPPGRYTLRIESYNLMYSGYTPPLLLDIHIRHPWWGLWYAQAGAAILVLALGYFLFRRYMKAERRKQEIRADTEKKMIQLEMQALQAQMNPHFIFNCVNGIQYYVMASKMDEVLSYLSDFSRVVRESLENATRRMVPLEQECGFLHSYLRLEQMRFPDLFEYEIHHLNGLNTGIVTIPPMLVQPFAENAIRHGFATSVRKGRLSIVFEPVSGDILKCTVTDNGIGRENSKKHARVADNEERPHSATITETRLRHFNTPDNRDKYKLVYTDLYTEGQASGLKVELYLPAEVYSGGR